MTDVPTTTRQLHSLVTSDGTLRLSLATVPLPALGDDDVLVRVEAAPLNPSDIGLLLAGADPATLTASAGADGPVVTGHLSPGTLAAMAGRFDKALPAGNEGAGVVVAAGSSPAASALLGKVVAVLGGAMYADYRVLPAAQCLPMHDGTTPAQGASCFVNPLTALGMVETMRREGHTALVHTAAASNLGRMLVRICLADDVPLVNVVRRREQVSLLHDLGATHVCDSSATTFPDDLVHALRATGATIAFDAIGGGTLASQILTAMEAAALADAAEYSRYGSGTHKQVYIYGGLDRRPTELHRTFGMAWSVGGWLLLPFLQRIGPDAARQLRQRVADEVTTTFASSYTGTISLADALRPDVIAAYARQATGSKYLIAPQQ